MRNAEVKQMRVADNNALVGLLAKARQEEKKDQHLAFFNSPCHSVYSRTAKRVFRRRDH
ncbi:DUF2732 family protein [Candidatus Symbiopectobacterium sp. 'North America']|uniref:DUF2732 family protein n=1 Tax=Candidatus Symbiopectobacterium sp. 'North America' TaxID=2794574 RepID=UPI0035ABB618